jgi:hypothetical protein
MVALVGVLKIAAMQGKQNAHCILTLQIADCSTTRQC